MFAAVFQLSAVAFQFLSAAFRLSFVARQRLFTNQFTKGVRSDSGISMGREDFLIILFIKADGVDLLQPDLISSPIAKERLLSNYIKTGMSTTKSVATAKTTKRKYITYGGEAGSIPFGRNTTEAELDAYNTIKTAIEGDNTNFDANTMRVSRIKEKN